MLIGMINKLIDSGQMQRSDETVTNLLTEMTEYFSYHFETEEQLLLENDCSQYTEHCAEHQKFVERVIDFCGDDLNQSDTIVKEMADYLGNWLINHVLKTDMQYTSFLQEKGLH